MIHLSHAEARRGEGVASLALGPTDGITPSCCNNCNRSKPPQHSTHLPLPSKRQTSIPSTLILLPVGGTEVVIWLRKGPLCVPVTLQRTEIRCPSPIRSSKVILASGIAARSEARLCFKISPPVRLLEGGKCITSLGEAISSMTARL